MRGAARKGCWLVEWEAQDRMVAHICRLCDDLVCAPQQMVSRRREEMVYPPVHHLPGTLF